MPAARQVRTPPTDDWDALQRRLHWPEQVAYELIRPAVLGLARVEQIGAATRTIARRAAVFDHAGFAGVLRTEASSQRLPGGIREALRLLKGEYPAFNPHALASSVTVRCGLRLRDDTGKRVLDTGPVPVAPPRRFLPHHQLASGTKRRLAIVRLHLEGGSVPRIAGYLETSRQTVYTGLQRWVDEDFAGLPDKSRARRLRAHHGRKPPVSTAGGGKGAGDASHRTGLGRALAGVFHHEAVGRIPSMLLRVQSGMREETAHVTRSRPQSVAFARRFRYRGRAEPGGAVRARRYQAP